MMDKVVINLLKVQNQLRILHWQTTSYAAHQAFGRTYDDLNDLIDTFVEIHQGKYGVLRYESPVEFNLVNIDEIEIESVLAELADYLTGTFNDMHDPVKDADCLNIRDEILTVINKLRYLLTLK